MLRLSLICLAALSLVACGDDDGGMDSGTADSSMMDTATSDTSTADTGTTDTGTADTGGDDGGGGDTGVEGCVGAPMAPITISDSCPTFAACGGDVEGSWTYTSACLEFDLAALTEMCPGSSVEFDSWIQACVDIDATTVSRQGALSLGGTATVVGLCALGCGMVESALMDAFDDVSCTDECVCTFRTTQDVALEAASYALEGDTIVTDPGTATERRFDYCIEGGSLVYDEQDEDGDPGIFTLDPA